MIDTIKAVLENTQNRTPMVHSITNNVTIHDCANIILAAGGTAIMPPVPARSGVKCVPVC